MISLRNLSFLLLLLTVSSSNGKSRSKSKLTQTVIDDGSIIITDDCDCNKPSKEGEVSVKRMGKSPDDPIVITKRGSCCDKADSSSTKSKLIPVPVPIPIPFMRQYYYPSGPSLPPPSPPSGQMSMASSTVHSAPHSFSFYPISFSGYPASMIVHPSSQLYYPPQHYQSPSRSPSMPLSVQQFDAKSLFFPTLDNQQISDNIYPDMEWSLDQTMDASFLDHSSYQISKPFSSIPSLGYDYDDPYPNLWP